MSDVHYYNGREERSGIITDHEAEGMRMLHDDVTPDDPLGPNRLTFEVPAAPRPPTRLEAEVEAVRLKLETEGTTVLTNEELTACARAGMHIRYPVVR